MHSGSQVHSLLPSPAPAADGHQPPVFSLTPDQSRPAPPQRRHLIEQQQLDKLGEFIYHDSSFVALHGLSAAFRSRRGLHDWGPLTRVHAHLGARLLRQYRAHGVPCTLADAPWSASDHQHAIQRGPHQSARDYIEFLRQDMADMVAKGFWIVLPFTAVQHEPQLRLSPIGVVPQHERRPRPIVDYSFYGINDVTQPNAALDAMQFGRTLERVIRKIVLANPRYGAVHLMKGDLSDGFYRLWLTRAASLQLGVTFPHLPGEPPLVAIPLALPMGWKNSPPIFCSATETIADVTNARLLRNFLEPPHPLERLADTPPATNPPAPLPPPEHVAVPVPTRPDPHLHLASRRRLHYIDVYVDDFIGVVQGDARQRAHVRRTLFNTIDDVFRPCDTTDAPQRQQPISVKKLAAGDGCWSTQKTILGWNIDTQANTISLTDRRRRRLQDLLAAFPPTRKRCSVKDWQKLLGELRSMTLALPGARHLFSFLHAVLPPDHVHRLRLTASVHLILTDFRLLLDQIDHRPTRLPELVPLFPTLRGTHDAAGHGMGGVWIPEPTAVPRPPLACSPAPPPIVWRAPFPPDVQRSLVTFNNPSGTITNSDLELAGSLLHHECAVHCFDVRERTLLSGTDNLGTLFWQRKASAHSQRVPAHLLRLQGAHQRYHRYVPLHDYIPGDDNRAADDASRLQHLSDDAFLAHFNLHYPQTQSWHLWHPTPAMLSALIYTLRNKPSPLAFIPPAPPPPMATGGFGSISATNWPWIHSFKTLATPSRSFKSSSTGTAQGGLPPTNAPFEPAQLKMQYEVLAKRSRQWGPRTHASPHKALWTSASHVKSGPTTRPTPLRIASNRFQSMF